MSNSAKPRSSKTRDTANFKRGLVSPVFYLCRCSHATRCRFDVVRSPREAPKRLGQGRITLPNSGIAGLPYRVVQAFAVKPGLLRNPTHAACMCSETKRVTHEIRATGFECYHNKGNRTLFGVDIVSGIKATVLGITMVAASSAPV